MERIDAGRAAGGDAGRGPAVHARVRQRLHLGALAFGDLDDPASNVSALLRENQHFRMHEELGTGPGFYYVWDKLPATEATP